MLVFANNAFQCHCLLLTCISFNEQSAHVNAARSAEFCENLLINWGVRFAGPIAILRNWTFCLFYVMAELWGSVVVSLLFWGFANQVSLFALILPAYCQFQLCSISCWHHLLHLLFCMLSLMFILSC